MLLDLIENRLWHRDELVRAGAVEGSEDVDCEVAKDPAVVNVDLGDPGALVDLEHETCIQPPPTISQAHLQCYIGKLRQCVYIYAAEAHRNARLTNNGSQDACGHAVTGCHETDSDSACAIEELAELGQGRILSGPLEEVLDGPLKSKRRSTQIQHDSALCGSRGDAIIGL